jgi:predicted nucleic acid-binding protein
VIVLDTSAIFAAANIGDRDHEVIVAEIERDPGPYIVPAGILAECTYMLQRALGFDAVDAFVEDLESHGFTLECGDADITRIRALLRRYRDLPLDFADAAVIACAERIGGKAVTTDHRHFIPVARGEKTFLVLPEHL